MATGTVNTVKKPTAGAAMDLLKVREGQIGGVACRTVDARELHKAVGSDRDFTNWIKQKIEKFGFQAGDDYEIIKTETKLDTPTLLDQKKHGGDRRSIEYRLTVEMAKEVAMTQNTEIGREVRKYFIECERKLREGWPNEPESETVSPPGERIAILSMQQIVIHKAWKIACKEFARNMKTVQNGDAKAEAAGLVLAQGQVHKLCQDIVNEAVLPVIDRHVELKEAWLNEVQIAIDAWKSP
jgi:phage anti-repressor protein